MEKKEYFKVYSANHIMGVGQPYLIITKREDEITQKILAEWFCVILNGNEKCKASTLKISFVNHKMLDDFESIILNEILTSAKNYLIYEEFYPKMQDQGNLIQFDFNFKEIEKSFLFNLNYKCPDLFKTVKRDTRCPSFNDYLDLVLSINFQIKTEYGKY